MRIATMWELDPEVWAVVVTVLTAIAYTLKRLRLLNWNGILRDAGDSDMVTDKMRDECKERVRMNASKIDQLENDRTKNMTDIGHLTKGMDKIEKKIDDTTRQLFDKIDGMKDTQRRVESYLELLVKRG